MVSSLEEKKDFSQQMRNILQTFSALSFLFFSCNLCSEFGGKEGGFSEDPIVLVLEYPFT